MIRSIELDVLKRGFKSLNIPKNKVAHAVFDKDIGSISPHFLEDHIEGVAHLSEKFAENFSNGDWGKVAGLLHDLGKGSVVFQEYIRKVTGFESEEMIGEAPVRGPNHSSHGAVWVIDNWKGINAKVFAYLIAGHHAGLPDWHNEIGGGGSLSVRLSKKEVDKLPELSHEWQENVVGNLLPPISAPCNARLDLASFHLWVRMLYSCLVDADYLDTEQFMENTNAAQRGTHQSLLELKEKFDDYMDTLVRLAEKTDVNNLRHQIYKECQHAATQQPGFFGLTVPTGGGKTLSGMAFALNHALVHEKKRIIVVIPYTSIIEQTAQEYKKIFGEDNVLEHHSNLDPEKETVQSNLATENWDAPIIITTNVQLFESLFAAKSSQCRKLHNIVNSVIICDEAQMIPSDYLQPILAVMQGLVNFFKVSIILSTATQPALTGIIGSGIAEFTGIDHGCVREIISEPEKMSRKFQRVIVHHAGKYKEWNELAEVLVSHQQLLCIVNTRNDCRDLHALMPEGTFLLSANLCGEHRSKIISRIKSLLRNKKPIRVISTQLVEAGVDIDFPVVYRAMAGFDSIAQAAGRCNREGRLEKGKVVVFEAPKLAPPGFLRKGADAGAEIMRIDPAGCQNLQPDIFCRYYKLFYGNGVASFDKKNILPLLVDGAGRGEVQFRTAAQKFRLINDESRVPVVVWYAGGNITGQQLIGKLKKKGPTRRLLRKMQRFIVSIPQHQFSANSESVLEEISGIWCQAVDYAYDETLGFVGLEMKPCDGAIFV